MPQVQALCGAWWALTAQRACKVSPGGQRVPPPACVSDCSTSEPSASAELRQARHARIGSMASGTRSRSRCCRFPLRGRLGCSRWARLRRLALGLLDRLDHDLAHDLSDVHVVSFTCCCRSRIAPDLGTLVVRPGCRGVGKSDPQRRLLEMLPTWCRIGGPVARPARRSRPSRSRGAVAAQAAVSAKVIAQRQMPRRRPRQRLVMNSCTGGGAPAPLGNGQTGEDISDSVRLNSSAERNLSSGSVPTP